MITKLNRQPPWGMLFFRLGQKQDNNNKSYKLKIRSGRDPITLFSFTIHWNITTIYFFALQRKIATLEYDLYAKIQLLFKCKPPLASDTFPDINYMLVSSVKDNDCYSY